MGGGEGQRGQKTTCLSAGRTEPPSLQNPVISEGGLTVSCCTSVATCQNHCLRVALPSWFPLTPVEKQHRTRFAT